MPPQPFATSPSFEQRLDHARTGVLYIFAHIEQVEARYAADIVSSLTTGLKLNSVLKSSSEPGSGNSTASTDVPAGTASDRAPFPSKGAAAGAVIARNFAAKKFAEKAEANLDLDSFFHARITMVWEAVKKYLGKVFHDLGDCYFKFLESLRDDTTKLIREMVEACLVLAGSGLLPWYRLATGIYDKGKALYDDAFRTLANFLETGGRRYDDGFAYDLVTGIHHAAWMRSAGSAIDLTAGILAAPVSVINGQLGVATKLLCTILKNAAGMFFRFCERRVLLKLRDEADTHLRADGYFVKGAFAMGGETRNALTHDAKAFRAWFSFYSRWPAVAALTVVSGMVTDRETYARLYSDGGATTRSDQIAAATRASQDNRQLCRRYLEQCGLKIKFGTPSLQAIMSHMMKAETSFVLAGPTPKQIELKRRRDRILKALRTLSAPEGGNVLWT